MTYNDHKPKRTENQKLYKASERGEISGVCVGLSDFLGIDVTLIRLFFVALLLTGGGGVIAYIVLAVVLPDEKTLYPERYDGKTYLHRHHV